MKIACKNVLGGWQTKLVETGELFGPVFNETTDLWDWQARTFSANGATTSTREDD